MATVKQKKAARKNVKKAVAAAKRKKTISHLSKKTRTALGKQGAKVAATNPKAKGQTPESLRLLDSSVLDEIRKSGFLDKFKK